MLIILTGPSCAGKSPLTKSFKKSMKERGLYFHSPILYHSRRKRSNEVEGEDFFFRSKKEIQELESSSQFQVFQIRDNRQAVDVSQFKDLIDQNDVIYEGHPEIAQFLRKMAIDEKKRVYDIFVSPLSQLEVHSIIENMSYSEFKNKLISWMARRLKRRYFNQKKEIGPKDYEDIKVRSQAIIDDLSRAADFTNVLVNHDGEDSDHWETFPFPIGEAGKAVTDLQNLVLQNKDSVFEKWPKDFMKKIKKND